MDDATLERFEKMTQGLLTMRSELMDMDLAPDVFKQATVKLEHLAGTIRDAYKSAKQLNLFLDKLIEDHDIR